ncbi:hypothetical protein QQ045_026675 [Rhodiola kirilowii]
MPGSFGARTGFTPHKFYSHVSKIDQLPSNVVYVCNKERKCKEDSGLETRKRGRAETRTNCEVRFGIHRTPTTFGKYRIYRLCLDHNHSLHTSDTIHMMPSQRRISDIQANEIELADASGIRVKQSHEFMSKRAGGVTCTGFIEKAKENPFFFYDLQLDSEEQITDIFWADAQTSEEILYRSRCSNDEGNKKYNARYECMYRYTREEEFERAWHIMLTKYSVQAVQHLHSNNFSAYTVTSRDETVEDNSGHDIQENVHLDISERYRHLCPKLVRLADYTAQSTKGYEFLLSQIDNLMKAVKIKGEEHVPIISPCDSSPPISYQGQDVKGLAKKARNHKGDKRFKPWFEKQTKKKKNEGKDKQPLDLSEIQYIKNGMVEMPANLAWLSEDRTTRHSMNVISLVFMTSVESPKVFDEDGQS